MIDKLLQSIKAQRTPSGLQRWRRWAAHLLRRKNILVDLNICAYGKHHLVERVQKFGTGYVFWSSACSGCKTGKALIAVYKDQKLKASTLHCAFLKSGLLTKHAVKVGKVCELPPRES